MKFVIATKNRSKQCEMRRILEAAGIECVADGEQGVCLPKVEETGHDFRENAMLKAVSALEATGLAACADDSGLCVDALDGAPGLYSARFAGEGATDAERIAKLLDAMDGASDRAAHFTCCICCALPNGSLLYCEGRCDGEIALAPDGNDGFGYDPVFVCGGVSFARMTPAQKDAVSHRGKALEKLERELPAFLKENGYQC